MNGKGTLLALGVLAVLAAAPLLHAGEAAPAYAPPLREAEPQRVAPPLDVVPYRDARGPDGYVPVHYGDLPEPVDASPPLVPVRRGLNEEIEERLAIVEGDTAPLPPVPSRLATPPLLQAKPLTAEEDILARAQRSGDRLVAVRGVAEDVLTIDTKLQDALVQVLRNYQTPYAAVVAIETATGRVLAMAEHSQANPTLRGLPVKAVFPAASVFKVVTTAALLHAGVAPEEEECFHGGKRKLTEKLLVDSPRDGRCLSLAQALAQSANVIFAKLTLKHLTAAALRETALALRFNRQIPFAVPAELSLAAIPEEGLGLASAGAGFGDVFLSPLHGAAIAAAIATGGVWHPPLLFEKDAATAGPGERILPAETAAALSQMMALTVTQGTAFKGFRERGHRTLGAAGKTGSLADKNPYRDYSWFIGFAPRDAPKVAVAAVVVNEARWRIHAPWLAAETLRLALSPP